MQTIERPAAQLRHGFIRRMLSRDGRSAAAQPPTQPARIPQVIDLRDDLPVAQWRAAVSDRLERLDRGMALVAETMKRAFAQVYRSIDDARAEGSAPEGQLERVLEESVASLKSAVDDLTEAVHRIPHVLAAAADDITAQLEAASADASEQTAPPPSIAPGPDPQAPAELLPATPFELEPIEEQFVPMDQDSEAGEARRIWGLEA